MSNFPIKIRYTDTNETESVEKPEDIKKNRPFVIESTSITWGRKSYK